MENTKIGNKEAIALLVTITFNQLIINGSKAILNTTASSSLLNILFISIIVIIFDCVICFFLNKFPIDLEHTLKPTLIVKCFFMRDKND